MTTCEKHGCPLTPLFTSAETWKQVPGFDYYDISDHGRVRSWRMYDQVQRPHLRKSEPRILTTRPTNCGGYPLIHLYDGNRVRHGRLIHRLVLEAFVGPRPPGAYACHNDGNPLNNHIGNLRWDTAKSNSADKLKHGTHLRGEDHGGAKLSESDVGTIRDLLSLGWTMRLIGARFGVSQATVCNIKNGNVWRHLNDHLETAEAV